MPFQNAFQASTKGLKVTAFVVAFVQYLTPGDPVLGEQGAYIGIGIPQMSVIQGVTNALSNPASTPDGTVTPNASRMGKYNELYMLNMFPTKHIAALAGLCYGVVGANAGVAAVTSLTGVTEASPFLIIENTAPSGGVSVLLEACRIQATAVAAAATDLQFTWKLDNVRGKWGSAGTALTPQNMSMGATNASAVTVHYGALVVATAQQSSANARTIASGYLNIPATAPACLIGDTYMFQFGSLDGIFNGLMTNVASAGANTFPIGKTFYVPPVILTPGATATLFVYGSSSATAASYNLSASWYEY